MHIKALVKQCHQQAKDKGFWDNEEFNVSEKLMLIVSELGEACEALRKQHTQSSTLDSKWKKDTFEDEIADVVIRIADLCGKMNIDLEWQIEQKLNYNKERPYKHGKHF